MKKVIINLMLVFLLCNCKGPGSFESGPCQKVRIASEIRIQAAHRIKNELGLVPFGFGGQMMDQIEVLELMFQCCRPIDIDEGRELLIRASDIFLTEINSNKLIRPYLSKYPFDPKNVTIMISIQNIDGSNVEAGKLCMMVMDEGILRYEIYDSVSNKIIRVCVEKYDDALLNYQSAKFVL